MNKIVFTLAICFTWINVHAQIYNGQLKISSIPAPAHHYQQEYTFDTVANPGAWLSVSKGMHTSFATTDELYFRREVPQLEKENKQFESRVWKGERLNAVVLVWSTDTTNQVRFTANDLKSKNGRVISKANFTLSLVRYVAGNYPYGAKDVTCGASPYKDLYLMPDRFEPLTRFDLPGNSLRPVWISLDVPQTTEPGEYEGSIDVRSQDHHSSLKFKVIVQRQVLPKPKEWKHRLDLWQNPWVVAWENNVQPWSEEHLALLKKHLKLYADAGGKYITTYATHSPWADNSYMIEGGMIEWIKRKDGSWKFDYAIFDKYVQLAINAGIDKAITLYTPVPWGFRFRILDEASGNYVHESWAPDSKMFSDIWNVFLTDLKKHLEGKGWFNITYLGINENAMDQTLAAIKVIKKHSSKWRITYAGDWHQELDLLLDDYCFLYGKESGVDIVKARTARGFTTTYYVCCNPPVPNNFVFSPPVEGRWISWYTAAHSYDGFLRWAYDAWPADPNRDARHDFWPAGDCFLVYPGGNSCIRFEKLREGIVDFEKIRILRAKAARSNDRQVKVLLSQLEDHLATLLLEKDFETKKIRADVDKGKQLIDQLSEKLNG
ncbi:MAG: DUF4091 domain-containing protein [Chitinophagaceae bacterium]|nr:DUF4091 domain-containing protein [Chitinophagaceae bacterium]